MRARWFVRLATRMANRAAPLAAPAFVTMMLAVLAARGAAQESGAAPFVPVLDEQGFLRATPGRPLRLPQDHGSHPATRTEWWYVTGALQGEGGQRFGFQATWFRRALLARQPAGRSPLAARDVMLFHGALMELDGGRVRFSEQACRAYPPWAHAAEGALDVALLGHSLRATDETARAARLQCGAGDARMDLDLDLSASAPLLHGSEPGLSRKGSEPGQASWYYSVPRITVSGTLVRPGAPDLRVTGHAWLDHEFGSSQLSVAQVGWDWFSVALDDGTDLMLYRLRRADGTTDTSSAGTLHDGNGRRVVLAAADFTNAATGSWVSARSGATYPSGWTIMVPGEQLELSVEPVLADQELLTPGSTGVTYWEGLCRFRGTRAGRPVAGEGYVELVGYAGHFTERL